MNSPYYKRFRISQAYKGSAHDGLDLVGIDSKEIHSTVNGTVVYAGWENVNNHSQGFGQYVKIKQDNSDRYFYFGHLSQIKVKIGDHIKTTQVIGIEGSTGYSTGSHCHYCCRRNGVKGNHLNINEISGIPNVEGGVYDDGYRVNEAKPQAQSTAKKLYLPKEDDTWRVYPLDKQPIIGNECAFLRPKKFGGLTYDIIRMVNPNVAIIQTRDFGIVQIYVAPDTGAIIK